MSIGDGGGGRLGGTGGGGRGTGGGVGMSGGVEFGLLSCSATAMSVSLVGRRTGRQGGLRSRRKGIVLLRLQYVVSDLSAVTILLVAAALHGTQY